MYTKRRPLYLPVCGLNRAHGLPFHIENEPLKKRLLTAIAATYYTEYQCRVTTEVASKERPVQAVVQMQEQVHSSRGRPFESLARMDSDWLKRDRTGKSAPGKAIEEIEEISYKPGTQRVMTVHSSRVPCTVSQSVHSYWFVSCAIQTLIENSDEPRDEGVMQPTDGLLFY